MIKLSVNVINVHSKLITKITYRVSQKNCIIRKQIPIVKKFTEPKISYIILWEYFVHFERHMSVHIKLFPKYYIG